MNTSKKQELTPETREALLPGMRRQDGTGRRADKDADAALLSPLALMALGLAGAVSAAELVQRSDAKAAPDADAVPAGADTTAWSEPVTTAPAPEGTSGMQTQLNALVVAMLDESAAGRTVAMAASDGAGQAPASDSNSTGGGAAEVANVGAAIDAGQTASAFMDAVEPMLLAQATTGAGTPPPPPPAPDSGSGSGGGLTSGQVFAGVAAVAMAAALGSSGKGGAQTPADTTPPVAPTIGLANDTGTAGDKITSNGTVNVTGLEAGATWQYSTNGGQTWNAGTGTSFTLAGDGAKSVTVRQTDSAGNVGPASSALAFTLDTAAAAPTLALATNSGNAADSITNIGTVNVSGLEAGATWQYSSNGGDTWTNGTGTSFALSGDGSKSVVVRQTDVAGNSSAASAALSFTLDTASPVLQSFAENGAAKTITLTYDTSLDATNLPQAGAFTVVTGGVANAVQGIAVAGSVLTLTLANAFVSGSTSLRYTDPTAGDDASAIQDIAGNDAAGVAHGIVADGYVRGAQIYVDANANGVADPAELQPGVVTDAQGNFVLSGGALTGSIIAVGGVSTDTGIPNTIPLKAPAGSTMVNPLTTLTQALIQASGGTLSAADASGKVVAALGLTLPGGTNLTNYDPLSATGAAALTAQKAMAQVDTLLTLAQASPLEGLTGAQATAAVLQNFVTSINAAVAGETTLNLANQATLNTLVANGATGAAATSAQAANSGIAAAANLAAIGNVQSQFLDHTLPAAPGIDLLAASDSGNSNTDNLTNITTPTLRLSLVVATNDGTAAVAGDTVTVKDGAATVGSKVIAASDLAQGFVDVTLNALGQGAHNLSATVTDRGPNSSAASSTLAVTIDTTAPTATIVLADAALQSGEASGVTITFSEAVTGFTNADLTVANGTLSAVASGDGGKTWTASFTPQANLESATNAITLANTGVADLAGNAGVGTSTSNNYAIDTKAPTVSSILLADTALKSGETSLVTITFSEPVNGFTNADLTVPNGNLSAVASGDGGKTWTATYTPTANTESATNAITVANTGVTDLAGNAGAGSTASGNFAIDTKAPTATIAMADTALKAGETSGVTITFSEAVTGFDNTDLSLANGTLTPVQSADGGKTWTATFTPTANLESATNVITLASGGVSDLAGNASTSGASSVNYAIDTKVPTVSSITMADTALKTGDTSLVTITFSEAVTGFDNTDLGFPSGTLTPVASSNGGTVWTATFTPTPGVEAATNAITLAAARVTDLAGNANSGAGNSVNYAVDTKAPTATIVTADTALKAGDTSLVTITFSEAVTGFDNADLSVTDGTLSALASSDGGKTWTATLTPQVDAQSSVPLTISLANTGVADLAGNAGAGTTASNSYTLDTLAPTATIVVADTALQAGETSGVTITFSEPVTGFDIADLSLANANGSLSNPASGDGGKTWTATFTPTANIEDVTNTIALVSAGVTDLAGNPSIGNPSSNNYAIDTKAPVLTPLSPADNGLTLGLAGNLVLSASETVTKGAAGTVSLFKADNTLVESINVNSAQVSITGTGGNTRISIDPSADLIKDQGYYVKASSGAFVDAAGNAWAGIADATTWNFTGAGISLAINPVAGDDKVNLAESAQAITVTGTLGAEAAILQEFTSANMTAVLHPSSGADVALTNLTYVYAGGGSTTGTWSAVIPQPALVGVVDYTLNVSFSGAGGAAAGLSGTGSKPIQVDTVAPTVSSIVMADTALKAGDTSLVTITFSEQVTGFANGDLSGVSGTLTDVASSDGGKTWTATLTPPAGTESASNAITLAASGVTDLAGNAGTGSGNGGNYSVDTKAPTVTSILMADTALKAGETSLVTITFSENVTGFDNADLAGINGTLSNVVSGDGGKTWTATLTPAANNETATNAITLAAAGVTDLAGNAGTGSGNSGNYSVDTKAPTVTSIVMADTALKAGETSLVTITFSENVTGFDNTDLAGINGTLSNVASNDGGKTWTATLTPPAGTTSPTNAITLAAAGVTDLAGNSGNGSGNSGNYSIDTQAPSVTSIVMADTALKAGETSLVTITFSENVTGFDNSDLVFANGTLTPVASSNGGSVWTATFTPTAGLESATNAITLDASKVADQAGNAGTGSGNSGNFAIDTKAPGVTITQPTAPGAGTGALGFDIHFSEAVTGFDTTDVTVAGGSKGAFNGTGSSYTLLVTPTSSTTPVSMTVNVPASAAVDAAGNPSTAAAQFVASYLYGTGAADTLNPGALLDHIFLGAGNDKIKILNASDSTVALPDRVADFSTGDKVDLSSLLTGTGYTGSGQHDTGAGFVELKNLVLVKDAGTNSTTVTFDVTFDAATINGSKISGGLIDLYYDYSLAIDGFADTPKFGARPVWAAMAYNLSLADTTTVDKINGQIGLGATQDTQLVNNPIITPANVATGAVLNMSLTLSGQLNTFQIGLESKAAGGATYLTTANGQSIDVDVGVPKTAGLVFGTNGALEIYTDSGTLGTVGDNQLHMVSTYDAGNNVTHLQVQYDTNATFGTTALSSIIAMDFDGDVASKLTPANLIFI